MASEETFKIEIEIPTGTTVGDLITVRGAISDAAATFVDWELLHQSDPRAIQAPGRVLLGIANEIRKATG